MTTETAVHPMFVDSVRNAANAGAPTMPETVKLLCNAIDSLRDTLESKERQVSDLLATVQEQAAIIRALHKH